MNEPTVAAPLSCQDSNTLYYDGQCPLCAGEIASLRKARGSALRLVDIHTLGGDEGHRPSRDELLRNLHLQRSDGSWLTGADANVAAWAGTRRGRLLRILRWPLLRSLVDAVYARWARWRYRRLYGPGTPGGQRAADRH